MEIKDKLSDGRGRFVKFAITKLVHQDNGKDIVLFPMIHVASKSFYDKIKENLDKMDHVLFETVYVKGLELIFRFGIFKWAKNCGLQYQGDVIEFNDRNVSTHIDIDEIIKHNIFEALYFLLHEIFFWLLSFLPIMTASLFLMLVEVTSMVDWSENNPCIKKPSKRDTIMSNNILKYLQENKDIPKTIGIIIGLRHMPYILKTLKDNGYSIIEQEWVSPIYEFNS